ncbi:MAG TPA: efflux RND transporter permease subunit [Gemmataceae bacterium]|nr:efflux RND transporter permease subunit [Gemmataceae bacterium]
MIERIIEYSIRNRFLVLIAAAGLTVWGIYAVLHTPMDAIPDLSENQVIVFTDWMGRSPKEIEDQITYPLSLKLQGLAGVKTIRSSSEFNFSMITIIFEDHVNFYFARQRVTEKLLGLTENDLPAGVKPYMAPDATALGQIFWYTVEGGGLDPARLWALQKYYIGPQLNSAPGVAEVATVGGAPLEYQIDVKPEALRAYEVTLGDLYAAVARSNLAVGGRVVHKNNAEYLVRGVGWIRDKKDIEDIVIREKQGTPIYVRNVATVQLGTQFRRSVFEKDGNEVVGGVVMMRYGENPLAVTQRIKDKIQELQPGLPEGVRIVPAYDRTRLIHGAIDTLTTVMWHEMVIASLAIFLILWHVRSAFVICITLPLSVLFSFLLMWLLRVLGIIDIQANIMSLAGITISIGILVDQAIVMTENATHHLKEHFGNRKVRGDIRALVIPACRVVGRPIFFSVMIMLISFIPVFALSGREGKYFHPLAFTKTFALIGVALISVTVVPALIPTFIKGRLRSEEENWIVRSFINIYKPVLTWALPRRNLVMWAFAVLLILAAGMFPLQALIGLGASESAWRTAFLAVLALVIAITVIFTRGLHWQVLSFVTLVLIGLWAYHFPKIGVSFMPALDEGSTLDMPVTVPRASVTQAADDLKARDALLRGFPEVESVIGKAGRADTATDPAPLDMVETFVNYRPKELWPRRVLKFNDAVQQTRAVLRALEERGYLLESSHADDRDSLINDATMRALERFDETMRELALLRYREFERELEPILTHFAVAETIDRIRRAGRLHWPPGTDPDRIADELTRRLTVEHGQWLARNPAAEEVTRLTRTVAGHLATMGAIDSAADALAFRPINLRDYLSQAIEVLGVEPKTFAGEVLRAVEEKRMALWRERVKKVNWELFDHGVLLYTGYAMEELAKAADRSGLLSGAPHGPELARSAGLTPSNPGGTPALAALRDELARPFADRVFFWPRQSGPKGDLVDDEMGRVLQVPGWSNIFTQPIINRIDMLSTGVRTDIGVKVFGPDLETIDRVGKQIEQVLKPIPGARDVIAAPIMGKGYLEIVPDRRKAARYGISVADINDAIEVALGGRVVTQTVEERNRFPVRIRYARAQREDEETVRRLLVSAGSMAVPTAMAAAPGGMTGPAAGGEMRATMAPAVPDDPHQAAPEHATTGRPPMQVPLGEVADVRIVEGPAMIKSENGRLLNYVTLNVRGRDTVGFVDEARRVVAEKVQLPEGVHIEWSGEFEHQVRAANTLRFVFPAVIALIFLILYLTYHDLADAALMMLAVPEALAGGAFFMFLFPKIIHGWDAPPMDFSVAVWVGFIACFGMATETGIIMLVYLREAIDKRGGLEKIGSLAELRQAVIEGAVHRLRPKLLTEGVAIIAIAPMLWASGVGGEILAPMALPVLGGLLISDEVVDIFLPVRFYWVRRARWLKMHAPTGQPFAA